MEFLRSSRFTKALNSYVTDNYFPTLLILFGAIVFVFFTTKDYIPYGARVVMPWLLLLMVSAQELRSKAVVLFWVIACLLLNLGLNFYVSANHGFMIAFIGLALLIATCTREGGEILMQRMAVLLISILMGWALVQKMVSVHYMSGNLIGTYLATGQMFKVLLSFAVPDWVQIVQDNLNAQKALIADASVKSVSVTIPPLVAGLAMILTYTALFCQAGLEVLILLHRRLGMVTHYAVLLFVVIIYATRNENVFLSMNLILGYAMTDDDTKPARLWYVIWIIYLLGMEMMGLRPGLIG